MINKFKMACQLFKTNIISFFNKKSPLEEYEMQNFISIKNFRVSMLNLTKEKNYMSQERVKFENEPNNFVYANFEEPQTKQEYLNFFCKFTKKSEFHKKLSTIVKEAKKHFNNENLLTSNIKNNRLYEINALEEALNNKSRFKLNASISEKQKDDLRELSDSAGHYDLPEDYASKNSKNYTIYDDEQLYRLCRKILKNTPKAWFGSFNSDNDLFYKIQSLLENATSYLDSGHRNGTEIYCNKHLITTFYIKHGSENKNKALPEQKEVKTYRSKNRNSHKYTTEQIKNSHVLQIKQDFFEEKKRLIEQEQKLIEQEQKLIQEKKQLIIEREKELKNINTFSAHSNKTLDRSYTGNTKAMTIPHPCTPIEKEQLSDSRNYCSEIFSNALQKNKTSNRHRQSNNFFSNSSSSCTPNNNETKVDNVIKSSSSNSDSYSDEVMRSNNDKNKNFSQHKSRNSTGFFSGSFTPNSNEIKLENVKQSYSSPESKTP